MIFVPLVGALAVLFWGMIYQCFARFGYMDSERIDWRAHGLVAFTVTYAFVGFYLLA